MNFMYETVDRRKKKREVKEMLRTAQVNPMAFTALYLGLTTLMSFVTEFFRNNPSSGFFGMFLNILTSLMSSVLLVGLIIYCITVRQGRRAEFSTLFDGFSFVGRVVGLAILQTLFVFLWSLLFVIPGIVASYRYQFAYINLCENPEIGCMDALELSKKQTNGYKGQLFMLDLSYLGWILLSLIPSSIYTAYLTSSTTQQILNNIETLNNVGTLTPDYASALVYASTSPLILLLLSLWSAAVGLFYVTQRQCVVLDYYEAAVRTSGQSPRFEQSGGIGIDGGFGGQNGSSGNFGGFGNSDVNTGDSGESDDSGKSDGSGESD